MGAYLGHYDNIAAQKYATQLTVRYTYTCTVRPFSQYMTYTIKKTGITAWCLVMSLLSVLLAVTRWVWWRSLVAPLGHTASTAASFHISLLNSQRGEAYDSLVQSGWRDRGKFNSHTLPPSHSLSFPLPSLSLSHFALFLCLSISYTSLKYNICQSQLLHFT
jgi:hypothetical protein